MSTIFTRQKGDDDGYDVPKPILPTTGSDVDDDDGPPKVSTAAPQDELRNPFMITKTNSCEKTSNHRMGWPTFGW